MTRILTRVLHRRPVLTLDDVYADALALTIGDPVVRVASAASHSSALIRAAEQVERDAEQMAYECVEALEDIRQAQRGRVRVSCEVCGGEYHTPAAAPEPYCSLCGRSWITGGPEIEERGAGLLTAEMAPVHRAVLAGNVSTVLADYAGRLADLRAGWREWADTERAGGRMDEEEYQRAESALYEPCGCPSARGWRGHRPGCPDGYDPSEDLPTILTCGRCGEPYRGYADEEPRRCDVCTTEEHGACQRAEQDQAQAPDAGAAVPVLVARNDEPPF